MKPIPSFRTAAARIRRLAVLGALVIAISTFGCNSPTSQHAAPRESAESSPASAVESPDTLTKAEVAFEGGYTRAQIKQALDRALPMYGSAVTDENYSRAASTLVALRRANGTHEMKILSHMIRSHVEGVKLSFPEAAAMSSVFLMAGDK